MSDVGQFEMTDYHNCGKGITEEKQGLPSFPSKQGQYIKHNSWFYYKLKELWKEKLKIPRPNNIDIKTIRLHFIFVIIYII